MGLLNFLCSSPITEVANVEITSVFTDFFIIINIPFAALKAQNVMKRVGFERYLIYSTSIGIAVNYKPRGGEWATPNTE